MRTDPSLTVASFARSLFGNNHDLSIITRRVIHQTRRSCACRRTVLGLPAEEQDRTKKSSVLRQAQGSRSRGGIVKKTIKIGKRGGSLAFRIPKAIAERFDIKVGDTIDSSIIEHVLIRSSVELERSKR